MFPKWGGFVVALDTKGTCVGALYQRAWQVGFDHNKKRRKDFQGLLLDRHARGTTVEGCKTGKPIKVLSIYVLRAGVWYQGGKTKSEIKLIFLVLYKKNEKWKNELIGRHVHCTKNNIIVLRKNSLPWRYFKVLKIRKHLPSKKKKKDVLSPTKADLSDISNSY